MAKNPRLLLINPWIYDFTAFDLWTKPIGLLYIASYLRQVGYHINFIDCLDKYHPLWNIPHSGKVKIKKYGTGPFSREPVQKPAVLSFVPRHFARYGLPEEVFIRYLKSIPAPQAVLVTSVMTYWYLGPTRVVELVRQIFPGVPVILGGIYATLLPQHARDVVKPDEIITGPGEISVENLLGQILNRVSRKKQALWQLDNFPWPALDLYSRLDYLPVMTSRGCPYHCTFCATDKISGPYAQRQPSSVFQEIKENVRRFKVRDVAFYDDALLLNKNKRIIPLLEMVIESGLGLRFHTPNGLHTRQINGKLARLFYKSGFTTIRLSFETADPGRRRDMSDKVSPDQLRKAVEHLRDAGYQAKSLESYVMMGLPHQNYQEVYESILFVHSLGIKIRLASFSPIPGTAEYKRAVQDDLFPADADPLLTNKTVYPLHRTPEAFRGFSEIRQLVNVFNYAVDRDTNILDNEDLKKALAKSLGSVR
jgi:molybdenum cofactor biosynthesis enzyme MoaA